MSLKNLRRRKFKNEVEAKLQLYVDVVSESRELGNFFDTFADNEKCDIQKKIRIESYQSYDENFILGEYRHKEKMMMEYFISPRNHRGCIALYDATSEDSFMNLEKWSGKTNGTDIMNELLKSNEIHCSENQEHPVNHECLEIAVCNDCRLSKSMCTKCNHDGCPFALCQDCVDIRNHNHAEKRAQEIFSSEESPKYNANMIIVACNCDKVTKEISKGLLLAASLRCPFYLLPKTNNYDSLTLSHDKIYKIILQRVINHYILSQVVTMSNPQIRLVEELCPRNPEKLTEIIIGANNSVSTQKISASNYLWRLPYITVLSCSSVFQGDLKEMGNAVELLNLNLSNSTISDRFPESIGKLKKLGILIMSSCSLRGPIPNGICYMRKLEELDLSKNQLEGSIPEGLWLLSHLTKLNLSHNRLNGTIPNNIEKLRNRLTYLNLSDNRLSGTIPDGFYSLINLKELYLEDNKFEGVISINITNLSNLSVFKLAKNSWTGIFDFGRIADYKLNEFMQTFLKSYKYYKGKGAEISRNKANNIVKLGAMWDMDENMNLNFMSKEEKDTFIKNELLWYCGMEFLPQVTCSKGHCLVSVDISHHWQCDGRIEPEGCKCNNEISNQPRWRCDNCNFDYCGPCYESKAEMIGSKLQKCHPLSGQQCQDCISHPSKEDYHEDATKKMDCHNHILTLRWCNGEDKLCDYCGQSNPRRFMWICTFCISNPFKLCLDCDLNPQMHVNFSTWSPDDNISDAKDNNQSSEGKLYFVETWFTNPALLSLLPTPVTVYNRKRDAIFKFIYKLFKAQNKHVLLCCGRLWCALMIAARSHPSEERELVSHAMDIEEMIARVFRCDSLDDKSKLFNLILQAQLSEDILQMSQKNVQFWKSTQSLIESEFLGMCLANNFKSVFSHPQILNELDNLIWGHLEPLNYHARDLLGNGNGNFQYGNSIALTCNNVYSLWWRPRSCAAVMFFWEGIMKALLLCLVAWVAIKVYSDRDSGEIPIEERVGSEYMLLLWVFCGIMYEIGQLEDTSYDLGGYLGETWNKLDVMYYTLLVIWAYNFIEQSSYALCRTALAFSAVPLCLGLLQYLSVNKGLGQLVIMIIGMTADLVTFIFVYVISILGFGIAFLAIFRDATEYSSVGDSLQTLFSSTMGNFDFSIFHGQPLYNAVGVVVLVLYVTMTGIVLVNLLIARMSSTYSKIEEKSLQEWSFVKANVVQNYLLLYEKSPLCMLPPPFNLIPIGFYPISKFMLSQSSSSISIAGTACNVIGSIVGILPRVSNAMTVLTIRFINKLFSDNDDENDDATDVILEMVTSLSVYFEEAEYHRGYMVCYLILYVTLMVEILATTPIFFPAYLFVFLQSQEDNDYYVTRVSIENIVKNSQSPMLKRLYYFMIYSIITCSCICAIPLSAISLVPIILLAIYGSDEDNDEYFFIDVDDYFDENFLKSLCGYLIIFVYRVVYLPILGCSCLALFVVFCAIGVAYVIFLIFGFPILFISCLSILALVFSILSIYMFSDELIIEVKYDFSSGRYKVCYSDITIENNYDDNDEDKNAAENNVDNEVNSNEKGRRSNEGIASTDVSKSAIHRRGSTTRKSIVMASRQQTHTELFFSNNPMVANMDAVASLESEMDESTTSTTVKSEETKSMDDSVRSSIDVSLVDISVIPNVSSLLVTEGNAYSQEADVDGQGIVTVSGPKCALGHTMVSKLTLLSNSSLFGCNTCNEVICEHNEMVYYYYCTECHSNMCMGCARIDSTIFTTKDTHNIFDDFFSFEDMRIIGGKMNDSIDGEEDSNIKNDEVIQELNAKIDYLQTQLSEVLTLLSKK